MTKQEVTELGKDMLDAKIKVLHKHGFNTSEISRVTGLSETIIKKRLDIMNVVE